MRQCGFPDGVAWLAYYVYKAKINAKANRSSTANATPSLRQTRLRRLQPRQRAAYDNGSSNSNNRSLGSRVANKDAPSFKCSNGLPFSRKICKWRQSNSPSGRCCKALPWTDNVASFAKRKGVGRDWRRLFLRLKTLKCSNSNSDDGSCCNSFCASLRTCVNSRTREKAERHRVNEWKMAAKNINPNTTRCYLKRRKVMSKMRREDPQSTRSQIQHHHA